MIRVGARALPHFDPALGLPKAESAGAAGLDIAVSLHADDRPRGVVVPPGGRAMLPTGLVLAIPEGHEGQLRPRSGLAARHGLTLANAPGTIDADYRGEVRVLVVNLGPQNVHVAHGTRVAQLVVKPLPRVEVVWSDDLSVTGRGEGGFGSTGTGPIGDPPA